MASLSQAGNAVCNVIGGAAMAILGTAGAVAAGTGTATGVAAVSAASGGVIPLAVGGISLAALWCNRGRQHSVDSTKDLSKIAEKVQKRFTHTEGHGYTRTLDMDAASSLLERALSDIALSPKALAEAAMKVKDGAFPTAATAQIMDALEAWCRGGKAQADDMATFQNARDFLIAVFNDGFTEAITNKAYFEKFEPQLLIEIAQETAKTRGLVEEVLNKLITEQDAREGNHQHVGLQIIATQDEMRAQFADVKQLISDTAHEAEQNAQRRHDELLAALQSNRPYSNQFSDALLNALADRTNGDLSLENQVADLIARFDAAQARIEAGEKPSNLDAFVRKVQKDVAEKMRAGDLDGADKEAGDAFTQWQRDEAERVEAAKQGGLAILDTGIDTALARGDADTAAQREWQKIQLEHDEAVWTGALWDRQTHYYKEGERTGARLDLQVSLALCEIGLETAPTPQDRAGHHNNKANALQVIGQRAGGEAGLTYLRQAIDAYDNALTFFTYETMPADWAMTQQNKANALGVMGERAGGEEGLTYLRQAIDAYDNALTVYSPETMPADWAMTRANMAMLFLTILEHAKDEYYLEEADEAAKDAMSVFQNGGMDWYAEDFQKIVDKITALKWRLQQ